MPANSTFVRAGGVWINSKLHFFFFLFHFLFHINFLFNYFFFFFSFFSLFFPISSPSQRCAVSLGLFFRNIRAIEGLSSACLSPQQGLGDALGCWGLFFAKCLTQNSSKLKPRQRKELCFWWGWLNKTKINECLRPHRFLKANCSNYWEQMRSN